MLPIPAHMQNYLKINQQEENNEFKANGQIVCDCGCDEFSLQFFGKEKEDFLATKKIEGISLLAIYFICNSCHKKVLLFCNELHGWDGLIYYRENHEKVNELLQKLNYKPTICDECNNLFYYIFVSISSEGKDDFVDNSKYEIEKGLLDKSDWINAFDWITIYIKCTKCGLEMNYIDYEAA